MIATINVSVVLIIELILHATGEGLTEEQQLDGWSLNVGIEAIAILVFILYEIIPMISEFYPENKYLHVSGQTVEWTLAVGSALSVFSMIWIVPSFFLEADESVNVVTAFGLLFIIPAVGLGEFFIKCADTKWCCPCYCTDRSVARRFCTVSIVPFLIMFYFLLDPLTATSYFTSVLVFYLDNFLIGVRTHLLVFAPDDDSSTGGGQSVHNGDADDDDGNIPDPDDANDDIPNSP